MFNTKKVFLFASLVVAALLCCGSAQAQNYAWYASVSGTEQQVVLCTHWGAGGDCFQTRTLWDNGTVSISVNGSKVSTNYGYASTPLSLAQALCAEMTSSFPIQCAGVTGSGSDWANISGTSNQTSAAYTVSASSTTTFKSDMNGPRDPSFSAYGSSSVSGFVNPKYVVLGVTYAPPGSLSKVIYSNSTTLGKSSSLSGSFATGVGYSVSVSSTVGSQGTVPDIGGKFGWSDTSTDTFSQNFTDETDTSSSVAISSTIGWQTTVPGPTNDYGGVDHNYDVIWLWLNPLVNFTVYPGQPNTVTWTGFSFDADDVPEMDVYGVYLGWLTGNLSSPGPGTSDFTPLQRNWAGLPSNGQIWLAGTSPSIINSTDYAAIAAADPFSNANYTVTIPPTPAGNLTSSDGRYTLTGNQVIDYVQPSPGGQPYTEQLYESQSLVQTQGQGAKTTNMIEYSWENKFTGSFFSDSFSLDVKNSDSLTWTDQWSHTNNQANTQSATGSVTGPACHVNGSVCSPVYTGPTEFEVYMDNIYGTYMFYPKVN